MQFLEQRRRLIARYLPLLAIVVAGAVVIGVVWLFTHLPDESAATSTPDLPQPTATDLPSVPVVGTDDKVQAQSQVNKFIAQYYGRDTELYVGSTSETQRRYEERLRPYVTEAFLADYLPSLDTPPDQKAEQYGLQVKASVIERSVFGHFDGDKSADQHMTVKIVSGVNGTTPQTVFLDVEVVLVKQDGVWLVSSIEELYS